MDKRSGASKVIAEAAAEAAAAEAAARPAQLSLLDGPDAVDVAEAGERRRRGRTPGAQNVATREMRELVLATNRSPFLTLARTQAQDPVELARYLGCKPIEAMGVILRAADMLMPYLYSKMPTEVDFRGAMPVFNLVTPEAAVEFYAGQAGAGGPVIQMADFCGSEAMEVALVGQSESDVSAEREADCASQADGHVIWDHGGEAGR
ncbi:MAG TPA: hypothetical protein VLL76_09050 [Candidatus Omnitrophota bacterium]|nr:hypothetical protein [Candidatus Omnitrophota bacterium]